MYERQPEYSGEDYDIYTHRPMGLQRFSGLSDWEMGPNQSDIRGWRLIDNRGEDLGQIDDLLISTDAQEAVFAIISYGGILGMGTKKTLVPFDQLRLDNASSRAIFLGSKQEFMNAPEYTEDTRSYGPYYDYWSGRVPGQKMAGTTEGMRDATGRIIPEVEEKLDVGKHQEQVGEVRAHKEVTSEEKTVREPVKRTRFHVFRREVAPGREVKPGEQVLREGETIEIPVVEEKLDVSKHTEVTGEVVIQPETYEEEEEATETLRKEHVKVENQGDVDLEEEEEEDRLHRGSL